MKKYIKVIICCIAVFLCNSSFGQLQEVLMLTVSSGPYSDQTAIRFLPDATDYFDSKYDAYKFDNRSMTPNLFTVSDQRYAINALQDTFEEKQLSLYFRSAFSGSYTLSSEEIGAFDSTWSITLVDQKMELEQDMRVDTTYVFQSEKGESEDRFLLKFKIQQPDVITAITNSNGNDAMIYAYGENILIPMEGSTDRVFITDMLGHELMHTEITMDKGSVWSFPPGKDGFYIVTLERNNKRFYKKVYTGSSYIL